MKILNFSRVSPRASEDCTICMEPLIGKVIAHSAIDSTAIHIFHKNCLKNWVTEHPASPKCPICKAKIEFSHGFKSKLKEVFFRAQNTPHYQQTPLAGASTPQEGDRYLSRMTTGYEYMSRGTVIPFMFVPPPMYK